MSTFITDTLKAKSTFPIMDAEDLDIKNESTLEVGLEPSSNEKLGRVKIGDTIDVDNGEISLTNFVSIGTEEPTDGSYFWINPEMSEENVEEATLQLISTKSWRPGTNSLQLLDDGFYIQGTKGFFSQVYYLDNKPFMLLSDISLYLNGTSGDDDTADGTSEKPFKTWGKLRGMLPKNMNGYSINLHFTGDFTSETYLDFEFYAGGWVRLYMEGTPTFTCLRFYGQSKYYTYDAFKVTLNSAVSQYHGCITVYCGAAIYFGTTKTNTAYTVTLTGYSNANGSPYSRGLWASQGGYISATNGYCTVVTTKCYQAYLAETGGELDIYNATGSNNRYGLSAHTGGVIRYSKYSISVISGGSARVAGTGGRIYTGSQSSLGNY